MFLPLRHLASCLQSDMFHVLCFHRQFPLVSPSPRQPPPALGSAAPAVECITHKMYSQLLQWRLEERHRKAGQGWLHGQLGVHGCILPDLGSNTIWNCSNTFVVCFSLPDTARWVFGYVSIGSIAAGKLNQAQINYLEWFQIVFQPWSAITAYTYTPTLGICFGLMNSYQPTTPCYYIISQSMVSGCLGWLWFEVIWYNLAIVLKAEDMKDMSL